MNCPQCQHENRDTAKFCEACGRSFALRCPLCDNEMRAGAIFCDQCGQQVSSSASTPPETQPIAQDAPSSSTSLISDAERRQLTVMFCDLVDSTRLSGHLDPEDLRAVVRAYQACAAGVIEQYEGHIAQYLGDGLLVYFGWPRAHEDDPHRAVHTGLGIVEAMDDLNMRLVTDYGVKLALRVGIHTGPVVVGEMGSGGHQENLALGETPNIAARLEGLAESNTVVISDVTRRLVASAFDYDELGTPELKGVHDAIPVFRIRAVSAAASRFEAAMTILTPMVGRDAEVALLMQRWEQAREGEGQVVLVSGPPGIGKSRLLQALCSRLDGMPHTRLRYQCSPYHTHSAFYPIVTQVTRAMQIPSATSANAKLDRLEALLDQLGLPVEEAAPLFAALLSIPTEDHYAPLTMSAQRQKERVIELFAQGLVNLSRQEPVLFCFEDAHWIDPTSLETLSHVIDQIQDARVLVVLTYRPEFEPPWNGAGHVTTHSLSRLSRRQTADLVEQVSGGKGLPREVLCQIMAKTDGIPLFIEELTQHVLESEWLTDAGTCYTLTGSLPPLAIPSTLQDSLMARLDRLASVKDTIQLGASIGREFSYALLNAVSPLSGLALQEALSQLIEAGLISQRGRLPEVTYSFKHALIQDAAYQSLLRRARQQIHQQVAQVLETQFAETVEQQPELVAYHYTEAGCPDQAVTYWQWAGERANRLSAYGEAIDHLSRGLDLLPLLADTPERTQSELALLVALGPPLIAIRGAGSPDVERVYSRARTLCQDMADSPKRFAVLSGLHYFYISRGEPRTAHELDSQLLSLAQHLHDPTLLPIAHACYGVGAWFLGDFRVAQTHLEQAWTLYQSLIHQDATFWSEPGPGSCGRFLALTLLLLGYADQAQQQSREMLALSQELGYPLSEMAALLSMVETQESCGKQEALAYAEKAITLGQEQGFAQYGTRALIARGRLLIALGQVDQGMQQMQEGLSAWRATGMEAGLSYHLARLAEGYVALGRSVEGFHVLAEAEDFVERTGERWCESELYRLKGELTLQAGRENLDSDAQSEVEADFQQALDIARQQHSKSFELRAATSLARLWQSQGKRDEARELLEPIYGWFTEGLDTANLIDAKALLDELA